jgi:transcriptional antiterminator RfaH
VLRWYVVQAKPREEHRAQHFLKEKDFHTYLPLMEVATIRGFREKPLFPGYLFCLFDHNSESLAHVKWTKGVAKILPKSAKPLPINDEVIAAIRSLEQQDGIIRKRSLGTNDRIRVSRGPMKDIVGIFDHWASDQGRVRVLLQFINYQASVELHHSCIEKIARASS